MRWLLPATFTLFSIGFSQSLPSFQLIQKVDGSGMDSVAGLGTDAQGNVYIAGTTSSQQFPVKNAVQPNLASAGLYRFSGSASAALGLSSCSFLALDPQNPSTIYAVSNGTLVGSVNSGVTFTATSLPSSHTLSIAIQPGNDQILFAGTVDQGVLKSADGGATWTAVNNGLPVQNGGQVSVQNLWIDPSNVSVIFVNTPNGLARTADGAANWQLTTIQHGARSISFDTSNAGVLYAASDSEGVVKSADSGQTFAPFPVPKGIGEAFPDPLQPGRLIGVGAALYQSTDGGASWTEESPTAVYDLVADRMNGVYYAAVAGTGLVTISANLQTLTQLGPRGPISNLSALAVAGGQLYAANLGSGDVFVTKLDPSGNILYSTYLGGRGNDQAMAMSVDGAGNIFVTGTTSSADFPVSQGAYASSGGVFLFRLNPDGSLGYSTYFSGTAPVAVATDGNGSAWLLGNSSGGLPVTPGAFATTFCCLGPGGGIGFGPPIIRQEATLTRFAPSGSALTFSTYVQGSSTSSGPGPITPAGALALAADGSAYLGGFAGLFHIDSTGSKLLASMTAAPVNPQAMAMGPDGTLYAAGLPENFRTTPGAFQTAVPPIPNLPSQARALSETGIVRIDPALTNILAATYFGSYAQVKAMITDSAGNLYIGGSTAAAGLPTRTPFQGGFAGSTGFLSELSGDLSSLWFSSYFGDTEIFGVSGVGIGLNGSVWIGGATNQRFSSQGNTGNVWINNLALAPAPALRIDSVENAASLADGPIAAGETVVVNGAGFGGSAQLTMGGMAVSPISITPTTITAMVPASVPAGAAAIEVQSGGASTNPVLMLVAATAPGIFSQSGTGYGQGYILNKDGTLNAPSNPAAPGDAITIFATGVGPLSFTPCCAVTEYPVNVYIDSIYCDGVAAIAGPVNGLPGNVYQITVYVPNPAVLFANRNPPVVLPPLDGVVMQINGVSSQAGIAISIAQ